MNFTIGLTIGFAEIIGARRIRKWLYENTRRTGRSGDGYDWIMDRRMIFSGKIQRTEDDE